MGIIVAAHYGEEERRIAATEAARSMFAELPSAIQQAIADGEFVPDMMGMANREYTTRSGGDIGAHLGAVTGALAIIARETMTPREADADPS